MQILARSAIPLLSVVAIGWIDLITGPDIGFSLFYLVPVVISAWFGGLAPAVIVAVAAALTWQWVDLQWSTSVPISLWNGFTRLVIYVSEAVLIAMLHHDREQLRKLAARESVLARTDRATNLPNSRAFVEAVQLELETARASGNPLTLVYIDLDNFKIINDRFGHAEGDGVLQRVGAAIEASIRDHDMAARMGGDEFAVLLRDVGPDVAKRVAERIVDKIRAIGLDYPQIGFGATVGVAYCRSLPDDAHALLRTADAAMYDGKEQGKGSVVVRESC